MSTIDHWKMDYIFILIILFNHHPIKLSEDLKNIRKVKTKVGTSRGALSIGMTQLS